MVAEVTVSARHQVRMEVRVQMVGQVSEGARQAGLLQVGHNLGGDSALQARGCSRIIPTCLSLSSLCWMYCCSHSTGLFTVGPWPG